MITLRMLPDALTVCKLADLRDFDTGTDFYFIGRTPEELSLVCRTSEAPAHSLAREDGWRGFAVAGPMDFSLVGVLSGIAGSLAARNIALFAVSTYDTDYILVKAPDFAPAAQALREAGYEVR